MTTKVHDLEEEDSCIEPLAYTIPTLCRACGFSTSTYYALQARGLGPRSFKVGAKRLVTRRDAIEWLQGLVSQTELGEAESARRASRALGVTLGRLSVGAVADVVVTDYLPPTAMTPENAAGHLLFGLGSEHVTNVLIGGEWVLRDGQIESCDEAGICRSAGNIASALWDRMADID